jgi:hypothetical protein
MANTVRVVVQPTTSTNDQKVKEVIQSIVTLIKEKHLG